MAAANSTIDSGIHSAEQLLGAGDIGPCELVRGNLVMMSPAGFEHGVVVQQIAALLHGFVAARSLGVVTAAETGFIIARSPDTVRAPDVAFVATSRLPKGRVAGYFEGPPDLAVEVLSPSDRRDAAGRAAVAAKIYDWIQAGTREVWVVDPDSRTLAIHRPAADAVVLAAAAAVTTNILPGFTAPIGRFFLPVG